MLEVMAGDLAYYFGTVQKVLVSIGFVAVVAVLVIARVVTVRRRTKRRGR
ncbi:hypothetical protein [Actinomadura geliboluensis]